MHELSIEEEIGALWREVYEAEGGDVDAALTTAHQQIADLLAYAVEWDVWAAALKASAV